MTIRILESNGSVSSTIPLGDIDHVETRTLCYFGEKAHNLYLILKKGDSGYFHLLTYLCQFNRDLAVKQLSDLLKNKGQDGDAAIEVVLELIPSAVSKGEGDDRIAL